MNPEVKYDPDVTNTLRTADYLGKTFFGCWLGLAFKKQLFYDPSKKF